MSNSPTYLNANWNVPSQIQTLVTTVNGGISTGNYASFNLASHVGDTIENVLHNRQLLSKSLPNSPIWMNQTHSNKVELITLRNIANSETPNCDAMITTETNLPLVVQTADCLPILFTDLSGSFVGVAHAGRVGLYSLILKNVIRMLTLFEADLNEIIFYIGSGICQNHYQVDQKIYDEFTELSPKFTQCFIDQGSGKFLLNLNQVAQIQLTHFGILPENIYSNNLCTFERSELFYSYRRNSVTGRNAHIIWKSS